jgi:hypothetical protein
MDRQKSRVCPVTKFSPTVLKSGEVGLLSHRKFLANFVLERTPQKPIFKENIQKSKKE